MTEPPAAAALSELRVLDLTRARVGGASLFKPLPFGRACTPEEIGTMIAFLASDHCSYNSGSVVTIDAGVSARSFNF